MPNGNQNTKRVQLDKDKTTILAMVALASVLAVACLVIGKGLWSQASYLSRVSDMKEDAVQQLEENKQSVESLTNAFNAFKDSNPNLIGGAKDGTGERDGDNATLALDALPSKYDFPAVTASVEKLLTGYSINNIEGIDDSINQAENTASGSVEIPFSFDALTNYEGFKQLITTLNRSIRPISVVKLELSGTDDALQAKIDAKTYYQPELGLKIETKEVK